MITKHNERHLPESERRGVYPAATSDDIIIRRACQLADRCNAHVALLLIAAAATCLALAWLSAGTAYAAGVTPLCIFAATLTGAAFVVRLVRLA